MSSVICHCETGLFWRIWHMDLVQSAVLYAVMTLVSTYLVAFAYKNVKFVLKHKWDSDPWFLCICWLDFSKDQFASLMLAKCLKPCIFRVAQKREDAVSKEVTRKLSEADNRKMSRKEKDERYACLNYVLIIVLFLFVCILRNESLSQDPLEEEWGRWLRGHNLLHLLQQHPVPLAGHRCLFLLAQELQSNSVSLLQYTCLLNRELL